jgi:hypothetical protein
LSLQVSPSLPLSVGQPDPWIKVEDPSIARHRELKVLLRESTASAKKFAQEIAILREKNEMQKQRLTESLEKKKAADSYAQTSSDQIQTYKLELNSKDRAKKRKNTSLSNTRSRIDALQQKKKKLLASQHMINQQLSERFGFLAEVFAKDSHSYWVGEILQRLKDGLRTELSHTLNDELAKWKPALETVLINGMRWQSFRELFPKARNKAGTKIVSFLMEDMPDPSTLDVFKLLLGADGVTKLFNEVPTLIRKNGHRFIISDIRVVYDASKESLQLEPKVKLNQK